MPTVIIIKTGGTMASLKSRRGDFEDWILAGMGIEDRQARVVDVAAGQPLPPAANAGGVIITGSHEMVTDRREWSERTASWLAEAASGGTPLLGICYGHQLLAHALGGVVDYNPRGEEMGTTEVTLLSAAFRDPLLDGLPATITVHVSHSQSVIRLSPAPSALPRTLGTQTRRSGLEPAPGACSSIPSSTPRSCERTRPRRRGPLT